MAPKLSVAFPRRVCQLSSCSSLSSTPTSSSAATSSRAFSTTPARSARLIKRHKRPYTFTQLIQLSDGSTYTARTTSPVAIYKSLTDTRNHLLWQPSDKALQNVEVDEAGKLAAFRERFGRGFDLSKMANEAEDAAAGKEAGAPASAAKGAAAQKEEAKSAKEVDEDDNYDPLNDLISSYAAAAEAAAPKPAAPKEKPKGKKK